ncbi:MAG: 4-hydroxy-2-oxo-heptane-1,7-dioate aldolase [Lysobacterales bacterium]|nr:MAG: 4-hydroxy-2-oxo-heptane-1,7-dioate aldolase [Xanthomonadales bacterium]
MELQTPDNPFKHALRKQQPQVGLWSSLCSNWAAEIIALSGFDWILIDMEHSPNDLGSLLGQLQVYESVPSTPVVRPPWNDPVIIKRILDLGVYNLLIPMVQTADDAAAAVRATRYPPNGIRGVSLNQRGNRFGRFKDYMTRAEEEICVIVQIETREALDRLEEIALVAGVDAVFFGPADLSASMGLLGQPGHPDVWAAIDDGLARCQKIGVPVGILTGQEPDALRCLRAGFAFVAAGADTALLARGADGLATRMQEGL